jgi:tripartite-type tricarboxylate transporter receptor subunit TctC
MRHTLNPLLIRPLALAGLLFLVLPGDLVAQQEWPKAKPITIVVGFAPGSTTDIVARTIAQKIGESTGQTVVIENKPGAGGNIATGYVKRAAADGYTVLAHSVAFAVNPSLYANAGYDAVKDFVPLAFGGRTPNIITVNPATAAKDLNELIALAKTSPLNYASSGIGTTTHLTIERLKSAASIAITHVPYQPAAAITAVVNVDASGHAADQGRQAARNRGNKRHAISVAAGCADRQRVRFQGL